MQTIFSYGPNDGMITNRIKIFYLLFFCISLSSQTQIPDYLTGENWDTAAKWTLAPAHDSVVKLTHFNGIHDDGIKLTYHLSPGRTEGSWVRMLKTPIVGFTEDQPVVMLIRADAYDDIELKFVDEDGSVFLKRYALNNRYKEWHHIVIYLADTHYGWGGNQSFGKLSTFEIAFSGDSSGSVWMDEIGIGKPDLVSGCFLDPYRESAGTGFMQRRASEMSAEDDFVYEYLEVMQDHSSADGFLLTNDEKTTLVSTFNSSLTVMAFILKNQKARAEKILDFYAAAIDSNNQDIAKQDFFYNGEARGYYQQINITDYKRGGGIEDRWIGDIAWLLIAFKHYQQKYGEKPEYQKVVTLIKDLLISFFKEVDEDCGCVQTGWQDGDTRFDTSCHHEGNIDCYAVFKLCDEEVYAQKVRNWLVKELSKNNLPLDTYTWRVLAFDEEAQDICNIPEFDMQYRKKYFIEQDSLYGFYPYANIDVSNIWTEGNGHMACAQLLYGDKERGFFYANQFDPMLLEYVLYGKMIKTLPYAINKTGDFSWIDPTIGAVSSASWYIFAKNAFNPLALKQLPVGEITASENIIPNSVVLHQNCPNPFNASTIIKFILAEQVHITLEVYDLLGQRVALLLQKSLPEGVYEITFSAPHLPSGIYFYKIQGKNVNTAKKMILIR
jgi:hypothetical protein